MTVSMTMPLALSPIDATPEKETREPPREAWYCAKSAGRLAFGAMESVTILGEKILIGRKRSGGLFALRDRCPHRGAPLSHGHFDGASVTCPFHGWRGSAPDGQCKAMPALVHDDDADPGRMKTQKLIRSARMTASFGFTWASSQPMPPPVLELMAQRALLAALRFRCWSTLR